MSQESEFQDFNSQVHATESKETCNSNPEEEYLNLLQTQLQTDTSLNITNREELLLKAAKYGRHELVEFLIRAKTNVNFEEIKGKKAIDFAWEQKNEDVIVLLLEADSVFPANFFNDKRYEKIINERKHFHELIKGDKVDEIKKLTNNGLKYYFNPQNKSAVFTAIINKSFKAFAYLKSIGADFKNSEEKNIINSLTDTEKSKLENELLLYFPKIEKSHLLYLTSKSRSEKEMEDFREKVERYYEKLNSVREINSILKVLQYSDYLDIIYDFEEEDVASIKPTTSHKSKTRGETNYKEGRIYIAAGSKRREKEILGTIAHELSHMAIEILYQNDCDPYYKYDDEKKERFKNICIKVENICQNVSSTEGEILKGCFKCYKVEEYPSELIVRVPQILIQCGRTWLEEETPNLLNYFYDEVILTCEKFIKESYILKPRNGVKLINETHGLINRLKEHSFYFTNLKNFKDLNTNICVVKAKSTYLTLIRLLQSLYGKIYLHVYERYLAFNVGMFFKEYKKIGQLFNSEGVDLLIIEYSHEEHIYEILKMYSESILEIKPDKKIIFIVKNKNLTDLQEKLSKFKFVKEKDLSFSLSDMESESQKKILKTKIIFQDNIISLKNLIGTDTNILNEKFIEKLLSGKVKIGNRIFGTSSLEGAYADVISDVNVEAFIHKFKTSKDIFIIRGLGQKKKFINWIKELDLTISSNEIEKFEYKKIDNTINKRIQLADEFFKDSDFKKICRDNPTFKIFLIDIETEKRKFVLKQFYNPEFYLKRKFKRIIVRNDVIGIFHNSIHSDESFMITYDDNDNDSDYLKRIRTYDSVQIYKSEEADAVFKKLKQSNNTIHWLKYENNKLIWMDSHGVIDYLLMKKDLTPSQKNLMEEKDLIKNIMETKVMLISDDPGMGKTTTITKLYENESIIKKHWLFRINLKDHLQPIRDIDDDFNSKKLVRFLMGIYPDQKTNFNINLLESAVLQENFPKPLLLAFDGFDEVLDEDDRNKIIHLFRYLKTEAKCKFWVTTRLQYKEKLETSLTKFAVEFDPVDDYNKGIFIKKYLKERLNLILSRTKFEEIFGSNDEIHENTKMWTFVTEFIKKMKDTFKQNIQRFIGTPLQLQLLLEDSADYFKNWIGGSKSLPDFSYLGDNILQVYQKFLERKYNFYFRKIRLQARMEREEEIEKFEKYHKHLAISLTCGFKHLDFLEKRKAKILLVGIVKSEGSSLEFIHTTFREYYVSLALVDYVKNEREITNFDTCEFLVKEILLKDVYQLVRTFMNIQLELLDFDISKQKKIGSIIAAENKDVDSYTSNILHIAIDEKNTNLIQFILQCCKHMSGDAIYTLLRTKDINGQSAFISSTNTDFQKETKIENEQIFGLLLPLICEKLSPEQINDLASEKDDNERNILIQAARGNSYIIVKLFFEILKNKLTKQQRYQMICLKSKNKAVLHVSIIARNFNITNLILEEALDVSSSEELLNFLCIRDEDGRNALHWAFDNTEIISLIFEKIDNRFSDEQFFKLLSAEDNNQRTLIHWAGSHNNIGIFSIIFKIKLTPKQLLDLLLMKDNVQRTPLHWAVNKNNRDIVRLILTKEREISILDPSIHLYRENDLIKNIEDFGKTTIYHYALEYSNDDMINLLFEKGLDPLTSGELSNLLRKTNIHLETIPHYCMRKNQKFAEKILKIMKDKLGKERIFLILCRVRNFFNQTPLHYAVLYCNQSIIDSIVTMASETFSQSDFNVFIGAEDKQQKTAYQYAIERNDVDILEIFHRYPDDLVIRLP